MKKFLFAIPILLLTLFATKAFSGNNIVPDITKIKSVISPGVSVFYGHCRFSWGGLKEYRLQEILDGATSISYDVSPITNYETGLVTKRCINIKTDVVDNQFKMPYVNLAAFKSSATPPVTSARMVRTASTPQVGSIFTVVDDPDNRNRKRISVGIPFTPNYFHCETDSNGYTFKFMQMAGIEDSIASGRIFYIESRTYTHECANISATLDPALLVAPPAPSVQPQPPVTCVQ